ncbi:MAG: hypothetical protein ABGY28_11830 [bacterium]
MYGYLGEHHSFGETDAQAGDYTEYLAARTLAKILNVDFAPDTSYDERRRTGHRAIRSYAPAMSCNRPGGLQPSVGRSWSPPACSSTEIPST